MPKRQLSKAVKNPEEEQPKDVGDEEKAEPQVEEKKPQGRRGRKPKEQPKVDEEKVPAKKQKVEKEMKEPDNELDTEKDVDDAEVKKPGKRGRKPKEVKNDTEKSKIDEKKPAKNGQKVKETDADTEELKEDDKLEEIEKKKPARKGRKAKEVDPEESENTDDKPEEAEKKQPAKRGRKAKEVKEDAKKSKLDEEEVKNDNEEEIKNGEDTQETKIPVVEEKKPAAKGRKVKQIKEDAEKPKVDEEEVKNADEEEIKNGKDTEELKNSVVEEKKPAAKGRKRKETKENGEKQEQKPADEEKEDEKKDKQEVEEKLPARRGRKPKESKEEPELAVNTEKEVKNKGTTDLSSINFTCDKLNKKGDEFNFKICSWNVGGVRAVVKKQGFEYIIKEDADIVVLQETKCTNEQLTEVMTLPGYKMYSQDTDGGKPGYCGVALYCKKEPIKVTYGLAGSNCDNEARIITAEFENHFIICSYHPNAGRKLVTMEKKLDWNEAFKTYVKDLDSKKPVIICGDLNVAHQAIDLKNPGTNEKSAGYTKQERDAMTDLLETGFVDTYRKLYPDATGAYTYWTYLGGARARNTGWRLDYFLTSERIADNICDNVIRSDVYGSDHCPIVLFANL